MTTLTNIFSREKTLFYFTMWNDSDRLGYEHFLNYSVKNNLFLIPHVGEKGSVWYAQEELSAIENLMEDKVQDKAFEFEIIETLDTNWQTLAPYLMEDKAIESPDELEEYYATLVKWWSAMNTVFGVPDMKGAPETFKEKVLSSRTQSEKYTERMNKVFIDFWRTQNEEVQDLYRVLLPEEAVSLAKGEMDEEAVQKVRERLAGCFMLNRKVYPLQLLEETLVAHDLTLEEVEVSDVDEVTGQPARRGKVSGVVKVVHVKADGEKVQEGDILVTEMTNPDYVPYMKVAAAVVTDEGGATCHAAIASRELGVPCIVGTKVATKVFKDGDEVEVDADSGVVRKI